MGAFFKTFISTWLLFILANHFDIAPSNDALFIGACILACGFIAHED